MRNKVRRESSSLNNDERLRFVFKKLLEHKRGIQSSTRKNTDTEGLQLIQCIKRILLYLMKEACLALVTGNTV